MHQYYSGFLRAAGALDAGYNCRRAHTVGTGVCAVYVPVIISVTAILDFPCKRGHYSSAVTSADGVAAAAGEAQNIRSYTCDAFDIIGKLVEVVEVCCCTAVYF